MISPLLEHNKHQLMNAGVPEELAETMMRMGVAYLSAPLWFDEKYWLDKLVKAGAEKEEAEMMISIAKGPYTAPQRTIPTRQSPHIVCDNKRVCA
jgi:hypothetical protein